MFGNFGGLFFSQKRKKKKGNQASSPHSLENEQKTEDSYAVSKYCVASCQSIGKERSHNEDTIFTANMLLAGLASPVAFGLFIVADGMGGHQSGEIASNLAAQGVSQYLLSHIFNGFLYESKDFTDSELKDILKSSVGEAQKLIRQRVPGGGTTLTFVLILGNRCYSVHVGDSRLYLLDQSNKLTLQTKDHTLVKRLVDLGEITEKEAGTHLQRNVLYKALGQSDPFEADIDQFSLNPGDRFLLCSDGLWGVLPDERMSEIIGKSPDMDQIVVDLTECANESGGPDNISVILVEKLR